MSLRDPDDLFTLAIVPFFAITFMGIVRYANRPDLEAYALLAPMLIALWGLSVSVAGEIIARDRIDGVLESVIATPANFTGIVLGRILAVTTLGLAGFGESLLVGWVGFDATLRLEHPWVFALAIALTAIGTSCTSMLLCGLFVVSRSPRIFQRAFSFPFYVLGGLLVPVSFLPDWIEPVSRLVFLSWAADLLRASVRQAPVEQLWLSTGAILLLSAMAALGGHHMIRTCLRRARQEGTMAYA